MVELAVLLGILLLSRKNNQGTSEPANSRIIRNSPDGKIDIVSIEKISKPTEIFDRKSIDYGMRRKTLIRDAAAYATSAQKWYQPLINNMPTSFTVDMVPGLLRFIAIESGFNVSQTTSLNEIGLTQLMVKHAKNWSPSELKAYKAKDTSVDDRCKLVWKHLAELDSGAPPSFDGPARIWRAYMLHGLPSFYKSLASQSFLIPDGPKPGGHLDDAWYDYVIPQGIRSFAYQGTSRGGLVRFVAAADMVAGYDRSNVWIHNARRGGVV